jgi:GNAT superfamily N-acetyltransferase
MTKVTSEKILDVYSKRIHDFFTDGGIHIKIERTKGSYKVVAYDSGKSVGRIYIQEIKESDRGYIAQLRRLHVSNSHRSTGLGRKLLETALDTFKDIDLYGHASPNRFDNMTDDNMEEYRNRLKSFYNSVGLENVGPGHRVEKKSLYL